MALLRTQRHGRPGASGFTLLEIVVTLVLLGLAAAVVAPVFRTESAADAGLKSVLAETREMAVRRAQTLVLEVDDHGSWRIIGVGDSLQIASGRFADATRDLRIRVNALGACFNEGAQGDLVLDAVACAVRPTGGR